MARISNNKILIGGAVAVIFLSVFAVVQNFLPRWQACQQIECECGVDGVNLRSPITTIRQKLNFDFEIMGYEFLYPQKLMGRCARLLFKFNDTHTFSVDVYPKDLTESEINELANPIAIYWEGAMGDAYNYASDLHYLIPVPKAGEIDPIYVEIKFLNRLMTLIEN